MTKMCNGNKWGPLHNILQNKTAYYNCVWLNWWGPLHDVEQTKTLMIGVYDWTDGSHFLSTNQTTFNEWMRFKMPPQIKLHFFLNCIRWNPIPLCNGQPLNTTLFPGIEKHPNVSHISTCSSQAWKICNDIRRVILPFSGVQTQDGIRDRKSQGYDFYPRIWRSEGGGRMPKSLAAMIWSDQMIRDLYLPNVDFYWYYGNQESFPWWFHYQTWPHSFRT